MFLKVHDSTGNYNGAFNNDVPDVVQETLAAFDHFIFHLRFIDDRIYFVLRLDFEIGDYEWWHVMNNHN
jgi:hypothetical protein